MRIRLLALSVSAILVWGCTGTTAAPPASTPSAAAAAATSAAPATQAAPKVVTFAGINALTGPSGGPGIRTQHGAELAAKLINDAGGFADSCGNKYTIKVTSADMANDRNQAIALFRRAADDSSVLAVIGPTPSVGLLPIIPVAGELKLTVIGLGTAPVPEWNKFAYRASTPREIADLAMLKKVVSSFKITKLAVIYDQTQDSEAAGAKVLQDQAAGLGYQIVASEGIRANDQDFSTQIDKIKATGTSWVAIFAGPPDLAKIARQMRERGLTADIIGTAGNLFDPAVWDLSNGAVKGGYTWTTFDFNAPNPLAKKFLDTYKTSFTDDSTLQSIWGNDALLTAVDAVKRSCSGTDREKFATAFGSTSSFQAIGGLMTFKNPPNGENQTPTVLVTKTTGRGTYEIVP